MKYMPRENRLNTLVAIWAGIATILGTVFAILEFFVPDTPDPNRLHIDNAETVLVVLEKLEQGIPELESSVFDSDEKQELVELVSNLDQIVTRNYNAINPNSDPFGINPNDTIYLIVPDGKSRPFSTNLLFENVGIFHVTFDNNTHSLRVGEIVEFRSGSVLCQVALMSIDKQLKIGFFEYRCT